MPNQFNVPNTVLSEANSYWGTASPQGHCDTEIMANFDKLLNVLFYNSGSNIYISIDINEANGSHISVTTTQLQWCC